MHHRNIAREKVSALPLLRHCNPYSCIKKLYETHNKVAGDFLRFFAFEFSKIYGKNHLIYFVHSLIHLAQDCLTHGPLDSFSAFTFENFLGLLKKKIRALKTVLAQLVKRISE